MVTSTSTAVTPGSLLISARTALAQWSQVIPVTAIQRVDTIVIVAPRWSVFVVWNSLRLRRFTPCPVTGIPAAFDKTWKPEDFEPQA